MNLLDHYWHVSRLARGGMADLYVTCRNDDRRCARPLVIKYMRPELTKDPHFVRMFINEARIAASIEHRNVCRIHEYGWSDNRYYIAMEYLRGASLGRLLNALKRSSKRLPVSIAIDLLLQAAEGLHAVHTLASDGGNPVSIVHRDVSPSNLFVTVDGAVKILDFGVAKDTTLDGFTRTGMLKGKYAYMSPEQTQAAALDARSDVFSLAAVCWETLTNGRLFKRDSEMNTLKAVARAEVPSATSLRSGVPQKVSDVLSRALSRDRRERYETAEDFGIALRAASGIETSRSLRLHLGRIIDKLFGQHLIGLQKSFTRAATERGNAREPAAPAVPISWEGSEPNRTTRKWHRAQG